MITNQLQDIFLSQLSHDTQASLTLFIQRATCKYSLCHNSDVNMNRLDRATLI